MTATKEDIKSIEGQFNKVVRRARAAEFIERAVPATLPPVLITAGFLALSWTGFWGAAPTVVKIAGSLAFAGAAAASPFIFGKKDPRVSEKDAVARLDSHIGDEKETPAETINDSLHEESDHIEEAFWRMNVKNTWDKFSDKFKAGTPKIENLRVMSAFTAATLGLATLSGAFLSDDRVGDVTQAFDWRFPASAEEGPAITKPIELKGWIAPPTTIEVDPVYFDHTSRDHRDGGSRLYFHEQSTLTILVMEQEANITVNGEKMALAKTLKTGTRRDPKTTYVYEMELNNNDVEIIVDNGPALYFHATNDTAPMAEINGIQFGTEDGDQSLNIEYTVDDDVEVRDGKIHIELSGDEADKSKKKPLPSTTLLPVPVR